MYTKPNTVDVIQAVLAALANDVGPELQSLKAKHSLHMSQALLQSVMQRILRETQLLVSEHNEMTALYRALKDRCSTSQGEAASRIRQRGEVLGSRVDLPAPLDQHHLVSAHRELSEALIPTLQDLDELIRAGNADAQTELDLVRTHLAKRALRDFQTLVPAPGASP